MSYTKIQTDYNTFKSDLDTLKSTSMMKFWKVNERTKEYQSTIERELEVHFLENGDIDLKLTEYINYINSILALYRDMSSTYWEHWGVKC